MPKFETTVHATGNNTGIIVPPEIIEELGSSRKPAVKVNVNGYEYRTTVGSRGGKFMLSLSKENRTKAGLSAGDAIKVEMSLDDGPKVVEPPADLLAALKDSPSASAAYEALTFSKQKWLVHAIEEAKKPETRARRIEKSVADLEAGKA